MKSGRFSSPMGRKSLRSLCDSAWDNMSTFVMALAHGAEGLYDSWMKNSRNFSHDLVQ